MVSERYDSGDRKTVGDGVSTENTAETDLDTFFGGFGTEISPLEMCKRAVQQNVVHSFKPTSTREIYEKWGKGVCEVCDEHFDAEQSEHECKCKGFSLLILHQGMRDELMVIVYHETKEEEEKTMSEEEAVDLKNMENTQIKENNPDLRSNSLEENTKHEESEKSIELQDKEEYPQKKMSRSGVYMLPQKERKKKKNRSKGRKKKNSKKKRESENRSSKKKVEITIEKNNKKIKVRKKKKKRWSGPGRAGVSGNRGAIEFGVLGERENVSHVCSGSGGGPGWWGRGRKKTEGRRTGITGIFCPFPDRSSGGGGEIRESVMKVIHLGFSASEKTRDSNGGGAEEVVGSVRGFSGEINVTAAGGGMVMTLEMKELGGKEEIRIKEKKEAGGGEEETTGNFCVMVDGTGGGDGGGGAAPDIEEGGQNQLCKGNENLRFLSFDEREFANGQLGLLLKKK